MKFLIAVFFYLIVHSTFANSYLNLSCFPRVFDIQELRKDSKINFYDNIKLEGEPVLVLSDKFYFKGDSLGLKIFQDQKKKKINKELFEKIPELIKRSEGVFLAFCPTSTVGVFQFKSKIGDLYFKADMGSFKYPGSFQIKDQNEIRILMEKHSGYKKGTDEYLECIKSGGKGCKEEISESVRLLLTFLTRIKDRSCFTKSKKLRDRLNDLNDETELFELEDPLIIPNSLTVSKEVMDEALGIFKIARNKNINYSLRLTSGVFQNEGGELNVDVYYYKNVGCFKLKGIIIRANYYYNMYNIQVVYPAAGG